MASPPTPSLAPLVWLLLAASLPLAACCQTGAPSPGAASTSAEAAADLPSPASTLPEALAHLPPITVRGEIAVAEAERRAWRAPGALLRVGDHALLLVPRVDDDAWYQRRGEETSVTGRLALIGKERDLRFADRGLTLQPIAHLREDAEAEPAATFEDDLALQQWLRGRRVRVRGRLVVEPGEGGLTRRAVVLSDGAVIPLRVVVEATEATDAMAGEEVVATAGLCPYLEAPITDRVGNGPTDQLPDSRENRAGNLALCQPKLQLAP